MTRIDQQAVAEARRICDRWVEALGLGFHPDTRGANYVPPFDAKTRAAYDADMDQLFSLPLDPYHFGVEAMWRRGLISDEEWNTP